MTLHLFSIDLSDAEWQILGPLLAPRTRRGRPRKHARRTMLDPVLYVLRGGVPWRLLPHEFPPWRSVHDQVRRWRQSGVWRRINDVLRGPTRQLAGRERDPHAAIIDSQSARTSEAGGERSYDGGKRISGRKRHLVVDLQGLDLHVLVHPAGVHDRRAAEVVLAGLSQRCPDVECLFADRGLPGPGLLARLGTWMDADGCEANRAVGSGSR